MAFNYPREAESVCIRLYDSADTRHSRVNSLTVVASRSLHLTLLLPLCIVLDDVLKSKELKASSFVPLMPICLRDSLPFHFSVLASSRRLTTSLIFSRPCVVHV